MTITEYTQEELDGQKVNVISVRDGEGKPSYETKQTEDVKMLSYVYVVYDGDEGTVYSQEYTYDEHGNLLSTVIYDGNGNQLSSETHTWKAIQVSIDCPRASA